MNLLIIPLLALLFIPAFADQESQDCVFTAHIEKSWVFFQDRPWVTGSVINCDDKIDPYKKDFVYMRILDINGDVVEDNLIMNTKTKLPVVSSDLPTALQGWKPDVIATRPPAPAKYVFSEDVYRGGFRGNADVSQVEVIHIRLNQYFLYLPQIHSIDFEHRGIYQIELSYGNHINTIWFAVLDPDKRWDEN